MRLRPLAALAAFSLAVAAQSAPSERGEDELALPPGTPPAAMLRSCRAMLPGKPVKLSGRIVRRNRKGIPSKEFDYTLLMDRSRNPAGISVSVFPKGATNEILSVRITRPDSGTAAIETRAPGRDPEHPDMAARVLGTDITWLDLTLDFLWWNDVSMEAESGETVHGIECAVLVAKPDGPSAGAEAARIWVDRKTGSMMQAEQLAPDGNGGWKTLRRLWGTRLKNFTLSGTGPDGEPRTCWMASAIEVQQSGGIHRTKITIEKVDDSPSGAEAP